MVAEADYDLVIIGGGIIGVCTAYFAMRGDPGRRTLLVERGMIGAGATQFSVGLNLPYGHTPLRRELAVHSHRLFAELRREIPSLPINDLPLSGVVGRSRVAEVIDNFVLPGVHAASADELTALHAAYPGLHLGEGQVVLAGGAGSHAVPAEITRIMAARFRRQFGGECREGVEVVYVESGNGRWNVYMSDGQAVSARHVVDATGPWMCAGPSHAFAAEQPIRIKKVAAMHIESPPPPGAPVLFFFDEDAFLLPLEEQGRWLFSFTLQVWDVEPESSGLMLMPEDRAAAIAVLSRYMPSLVAHCTNARVFCDAYGPGWTPVIGRAARGYVLAGAGSGSGYRLAPGIARRALALLAEEGDDAALAARSPAMNNHQ